MASFAASIVTLSTAVWVGAIVFQSAVVAPSVFTCLDKGQARVFLRVLFPRFFRLGLVCGAVTLAGAILLFAVHGGSSSVVLLISAAMLILVLAGISLGLIPKINAARDADVARFQRLHRLTVLLTIVSLVLGIAVLASVAAASALVVRA